MGAFCICFENQLDLCLFFQCPHQPMEFLKKQDTSKVIQGVFSLKNLGYFIKCTNLCSQIEMYLENDLPLVIKYSVASLGIVKLALAPLPSS